VTALRCEGEAELRALSAHISRLDPALWTHTGEGQQADRAAASGWQRWRASRQSAAASCMMLPVPLPACLLGLHIFACLPGGVRVYESLPRPRPLNAGRHASSIAACSLVSWLVVMICLSSKRCRIFSVPLTLEASTGSGHASHHAVLGLSDRANFR
jgi:hypothetical protein